jgi:hypothetical protein
VFKNRTTKTIEIVLRRRGGRIKEKEEENESKVSEALM